VELAGLCRLGFSPSREIKTKTDGINADLQNKQQILLWSLQAFVGWALAHQGK
tara:strand:+ start:180 stop:338 length:159 start_codon:yes stop_codon:yes gene_type:complete